MSDISILSVSFCVNEEDKNIHSTSDVQNQRFA